MAVPACRRRVSGLEFKNTADKIYVQVGRMFLENFKLREDYSWDLAKWYILPHLH